MRALVKYIMARTYRPLLVKYLSSVRTYSYAGIHLEIPPEVFHPGFFFSTKYLLAYIRRRKLHDKTFLELGAGSGLIAMYAARQHSKVTATDINPVAIEYLNKNAASNKVNLEIISSDLFEHIPAQKFDWIVINPPYYKKDPVTHGDHAWFCGRNGEYFRKLFRALGNHIHPASEVIMVLCDGCDIEMILQMAAEYSFVLQCEQSKDTIVEKNYIFSIIPKH